MIGDALVLRTAYQSEVLPMHTRAAGADMIHLPAGGYGPFAMLRQVGQPMGTNLVPSYAAWPYFDVALWPLRVAGDLYAGPRHQRMGDPHELERTGRAAHALASATHRLICPNSGESTLSA